MKFLTALIRHSRQPARGGDRPSDSLRAPAQPDLGAGALLAAEEPILAPDVAPSQTDSAPQAVDGGEGDRRPLASDPGEEGETDADPHAAVPAPGPERAIPDAGPEVSGPGPKAAMPVTPEPEPQTRQAPAAAPNPAPPPAPVAAVPARVQLPAERSAERRPESPAAAAPGPRGPARVARPPEVAPRVAAASGPSLAAKAPTTVSGQPVPKPDAGRIVAVAEPAPPRLAATPADERVPQQAIRPTSVPQPVRERVAAREAAGPVPRPTPEPRDWSPQPQPPEPPQVRIGQINVLVEDHAVAKPRTRISQPAPARSNPFGRRGL